MNNLNDRILKAAGTLKQGVLFILSPVFRLLGILLGSWQAPNWWHYGIKKCQPLFQWAARNAALSLLAGVLALGGLAAPRLMKIDWAAKFASMRSVQPDKADSTKSGVTVRNPDRTAVEDGGKPQPFALNFTASVAPLALVGKEVKDISISPAIAGKWLWTSVNRLEFTPTDDWPIDVEYSVQLGAKTLAAHVQAEREFHFNSPKFVMKIREATFYQDPVQAGLRKAVFEINFSHPVDQQSLEKKLKFVTESAAQDLFVNPNDAQKLTVIYDKFKVNATVYSEALRIPAQSLSLALHIQDGVKAVRGGNGSKEEKIKALLIPGLYSLDIAELKQLIVTGDNGEPENILQIATGMAVGEKEMTRATSAWLLPETHTNDSGETTVWGDPEEVTAEVLKKSKAITLSPIASERENTESHSFKFSAEPGRYMLVRIAKGLKSAGGYQLGVKRDEVFKIK
ncbi:MAG: alpha-2-macroglobulin family protein, partial [Undibacterium sp.]|nr:alpha-2-macroglobulin family protein [Undibacterium sp.]